MGSQEFISIPVPLDRVQEVYEVLGRPRASAQATVASTVDTPDGSIDVALVVRAYRESPPAMKKIFDFLASKPGKVSHMTEVAKAIGYTPNQTGGALGAFGRRWKNRYHGGQDTKWPFEAVWDHGVNMMRYSMDSETAKIIKGI